MRRLASIGSVKTSWPATIARPFGGRHVAGQDPHGRGLPGAVRPEKSENLAPFHAKTDIVHGRDPAVTLGDVLDLNHSDSPAEGSLGATCRDEAAAASF